MLALEDVQVGAADAHAADAEHDLARHRLGSRALDQAKRARRVAQDRPHQGTQCETRTGQVALSRMWRVMPPNIISRIREWP